MTCAEFVALATDYLDGVLNPEVTDRFAAHSRECDGCATYLRQLRATVALLGQL